MMDLNEPASIPIKLSTNGLPVFSVGVSTSGQCIALGSEGG